MGKLMDQSFLINQPSDLILISITASSLYQCFIKTKQKIKNDNLSKQECYTSSKREMGYLYFTGLKFTQGTSKCLELMHYKHFPAFK